MSPQFRHVPRLFGIFSLTILCLALVNSVATWCAATIPATGGSTAEDMVKEALYREIYGLDAERQQLLEQASEKSPDYAPAKWHLGFVRYQDKWMKADDLVEILRGNRDLAAYEREREKAAETIPGQMSIADWCRQHDLPEQERAHLARVLDMNPDHAVARARLGFLRVNGEWLTREDLDQMTLQLNQQRASLAKWQTRMEAIRAGLRDQSEAKRRRAADELLAIHDASAVPAMELILSPSSDEAALLVLRCLATMSEHEASLSLARHAIFSESPVVRQQAADNLKDRDREGFVPVLLSSMFSPVSSRVDIFRGRGNRMIFRHSFIREGQDENQLMVLDTEYRRISRAGGSRGQTLARAIGNAQSTATSRERRVEVQNRSTGAMNNRIAWVLNVATDQNLPAVPDAWWEWWNEENEVAMTGQKRTDTRYDVRRITLVDTASPQGSGGFGGRGASGASGARYECLAAGTPVWTSTGTVPVEKVQVGDLVLAQDPETGELAFKPVIRTTVRPVGPLLKIHVGGEAIEASGGHLFWVAGNGWVKASDLESGMELHAVNGSTRVSLVEEGEEEETYNLIVADFGSYFVGESRILCHDNTVRQPTNAVVPGLFAR